MEFLPVFYCWHKINNIKHKINNQSIILWDHSDHNLKRPNIPSKNLLITIITASVICVVSLISMKAGDCTWKMPILLLLLSPKNNSACLGSLMVMEVVGDLCRCLSCRLCGTTFRKRTVGEWTLQKGRLRESTQGNLLQNGRTISFGIRSGRN